MNKGKNGMGKNDHLENERKQKKSLEMAERENEK